jgi:hypothetical protein
MDMIATPNFERQQASAAFKVADVREQSAQFISQLADMFTQLGDAGTAAPSHCSRPEDAARTCPSAADLRLETELEALQKTKAQLAQEAEAQLGISDDPQALPPGRKVGQKFGHAEVADYQRTKEEVDEAFRTAIKHMQDRRAAERHAAKQVLRSLHDMPDAPAVRSTLKRRFMPSSAEHQSGVQDTKTAPNESTSNAARVGNGTASSHASANTNPNSTIVFPKEVGSGEVILHVAVHLPQAPSAASEEWLVLGSQPLTALKDRIYCLLETNAKAVELDIASRMPHPPPPPQQQQQRSGGSNGISRTSIGLVKPSSYFYIEGTFYIDRRNPAAKDISERIRLYLADHKIAAPPHPPPGAVSVATTAMTTKFSVDTMENRCFEDLWLRLGPGAPGLYCHQGGCEHLIVFKDVRLHDPTVDPALISQYPYKLSTPSATLVVHRHCEACGLRVARRVTYDDRSAPHTPFFWCDECFRLMHYDAQGRALYTDYKVFPYVHDYQLNLLTGNAGKRLGKASRTGADAEGNGGGGDASDAQGGGRGSRQN